MHWQDILCGLSKASLEIPHKISYRYIGRKICILLICENLRALRFRGSCFGVLEMPPGHQSEQLAAFPWQQRSILCSRHACTYATPTDTTCLQLFFCELSNYETEVSLWVPGEVLQHKPNATDFPGWDPLRHEVVIGFSIIFHWELNAKIIIVLLDHQHISWCMNTTYYMMTSSNGNNFRVTGH